MEKAADALFVHDDTGRILDVNRRACVSLGYSREELLASLMATMQAPIGQFVRTLNEVPARFVRTVAAVRDAKEKAGA